MKEIICPNCDKAFKVDETGYAEILKQVRDGEFKKELNERLELAEKEKISAIEIARRDVSDDMLKAVAAKESQITELKGVIRQNETAKKLAVSEALGEVEKERDNYKHQLENEKRESENASKLANSQHMEELQKINSTKDATIQSLRAELKNQATAQDLAVSKAISSLEKERDDLNNSLQRAVVRPEFPRHFPALKNTAVRTPLVALDYCEYDAASGCRTSRYS